MERVFYVYILTNKQNGTLYIGVTRDLLGRIWQHKNDINKGFTQKHKIHTLVYYEEHAYIEDAITKEKQIKKWNRDWKLRLIEKTNPKWKDLYEEIMKRNSNH